MADRIKGITVQIGGDTTGLSKALSGVNKEIGATQRELKDVERLLKFDPQNTELLEQKQRLLAESVQKTKEKLDALKKAEQQVQEQFKKGEASQKQYDGLKREIIDAEQKLSGLESEAREAERALSGIDEKPVSDVADAAEDAEKALDDAGKEASSFGDFLKAGAIVEGVKGISGAVSDLVADTQDYRKIMGSLDVSSSAAGYSAEETEEAYKRLFGVLGDSQTAATTTANLQALGLTQEELNNLIDSAIGAWATYGDSIPIDSLAEAINETIRSGEVTGTFADVLNWGSKEGENFGVKLRENIEANKEWNDAVTDAKTAEDFFNLALQEAGTETERANLVMQAMADQGLFAAGEAWRANNDDIVAANEAQADFTEKAAEMAERVSPVVAEVQEGMNNLFQTVLNATQGIDFNALAENVGKVFDVLSIVVTFLIENGDIVLSILAGIAAGIVMLQLTSFASSLMAVFKGVTTLSTAFPALGGVISALTNPIFLVTSAVVALVALIATKGDEIQAILQKVDDFLQNVFAVDWTTIFGPVLGNALNGFFSNIENLWNSVKRILDGIINFIRGVFTGDWERAWEGVKQIFSGIFEALVSVAKAPINGIISLVNGLIDGINDAIRWLNSLSFEIPDWIPGIGGNTFGFDLPTIGKIPLLAKGGVVRGGSAIVGDAGPELLTILGNGAAQVTPLTNNTTNTTYGGITVNLYGNLGDRSSAYEYGRIIGEQAWKEMRIRGAMV